MLRMLSKATKFLIIAHPPICVQVDGGVYEYKDQAIYKVAEILAERVASNEISYYVRWEGYDHTYNTWEPASNVEDASLTDEWDKGKRVVADVKQAIFDLSESRAKDLLKMKGPAFGKKTSENFT